MAQMVDEGLPNDCRSIIDSSARRGDKVCKFDAINGNHVICKAEDNTGACGSNHCSNANVDLGRYAMCPSSPGCGDKTLFVDSVTDLVGHLDNPQQLCVYQLIFYDVDPLDIIPDLNLQVWTLEGAKAEIFSKVEGGQLSKFYLEGEIHEETVYNIDVTNPED